MAEPSERSHLVQRRLSKGALNAPGADVLHLLHSQQSQDITICINGLSRTCVIIRRMSNPHSAVATRVNGK